MVQISKTCHKNRLWYFINRCLVRMSYRGLFTFSLCKKNERLGRKQALNENARDHLIWFITCLICRFTHGNWKNSSCSLHDSYSYSKCLQRFRSVCMAAACWFSDFSLSVMGSVSPVVCESAMCPGVSLNSFRKLSLIKDS